jgi:hypothetical protein
MVEEFYLDVLLENKFEPDQMSFNECSEDLHLSTHCMAAEWIKLAQKHLPLSMHQKSSKDSDWHNCLLFLNADSGFSWQSPFHVY